LGSGQRQSKFVILIHAEWIDCKLRQLFGDLIITDEPPLHTSGWVGLFAGGKKLKRSDAVPSKLCEEAVNIGSIGVHSFSQSFFDDTAIRKQVVEYRNHRIASVAVFTERH